MRVHRRPARSLRDLLRAANESGRQGSRRREGVNIVQASPGRTEDLRVVGASPETLVCPELKKGIVDHKTGCLVCGKQLSYMESASSAGCAYRGAVRQTNATCIDGHYVCDSCHSASAKDLIERYCINTSSTDPIAQALLLMKNPAVKMHGPEHHFVVPAVLLASYFNQKGLPAEEKANSIREARRRSEDVKGGFRGFHGACGAAIGTGIFVSIMTKATPLSAVEWRLSNRMTAESLGKIAEHDGPRCCKRNLFLSIVNAVGFLAREFGVETSTNRRPICTFGARNKECHHESCPFFAESMGTHISENSNSLPANPRDAAVPKVS
jgi:hypothetical protein